MPTDPFSRGVPARAGKNRRRRSGGPPSSRCTRARGEEPKRGRLSDRYCFEAKGAARRQAPPSARECVRVSTDAHGRAARMRTPHVVGTNTPRRGNGNASPPSYCRRRFESDRDGERRAETRRRQRRGNKAFSQTKFRLSHFALPPERAPVSSPTGTRTGRDCSKRARTMPRDGTGDNLLKRMEVMGRETKKTEGGGDKVECPPPPPLWYP